MNDESLGFIYLDQLEDTIAHIKQCNTDLNIENPKITFEFLIGQFFPKVLDNIHAELNHQYTLGYMAGLRGDTDDTGNND